MSQSQHPDGFSRALAKFKQGLDPSLAQQFSISTLEDVRILADKIQQDQGPQGKLCHMRRLGSFIEAMTQLGTVIEVFTNVNELICFIWGPIKFLLTLAKTHLDSLDKLLEAYGKIASSVRGLEEYKRTFQSHSPLARVLEDYYSDILNFHKRALEVFGRSNWKMLFDAAWKRFDSKFGPILQSLDNRRALLESGKASATLYEIHHALDEIKKISEEQVRMNKLVETEKHDRQKELIKRRLNPPNYWQDHRQILGKKIANSASGRWIFADPRYQAWHNSNVSGSKVLYVHGKPGSGKSVLVSTVIKELLGSNTAGAAVVFFYFRHSQEVNNTSRSSFDNLLRALLYQLIDQDPDLTDLMTNKSGNDKLRLEDPEVLQDLVRKAIGSHTTLYLILDGLDECQSEEEEDIIEWLLDLSKSVLGLRVMFAGQRDNVTDKLLSFQPSISLDTSTDHHRDITAYCQKVAEEIRRDFDAESLLEKTIVKLVSDGANGMFLYAKIVLEHLLAQPSVEDLEKELKPGVFPDSLEEAYKKVDERVFEKSARVRRAAASEILSYIIGCKRTLFWREIQAFFCINASEGEAVYKRRIKSYKELCSSFLDSNAANKNYNGPEDEIVLVHETAREFLIRKNRLNIHEQNSKLSIFCFRYLTSPPFTVGVSEEIVLSHAKRGYYALQDYTVQYWFDHLLECVKSLDPMSDRDKCQDVFNLALIFLRSYGNREKMAELLQAETYTELADAITKHLPTHDQERNAYLCIDIRTESLRQKIAKLDFEAFTAEEEKVFVNLHGPKTSYKCSKPWCDFFKGGLVSEANRRKHIDEHEFPHRCAYEDCMGFKLGFSTEDELQKHNRKWHSQQDDANSFPKLELSSSLSGNSNESSLHEACGRGDIERVKQLLEYDAGKEQIDRRGHNGKYDRSWEYPLCIAAEMGHKEICDLLISNGASVNIGEGAPLLKAAENGHLEVCKLLISNGAFVDIYEGRADINSTRGHDGKTPLQKAAEEGHVEIIGLLLQQDGIEPNKRLNGRVRPRTAAEVAAAKGHTQALRCMQASGKVDMSVGLLRSACIEISGSIDMIKYLLNSGHVDEADERCVWTVLGTVTSNSTKDFIAKAGLAIDMLLSTGNPVLSDVGRLAKELRSGSEKRTPLLISIMEYPKWRIKRSAWSKFVEGIVEVEMDDELREAVNKFVKRIDDNQSTTIVDDKPKVKGKGRPIWLAMETDEEMEEEMEEEDDSS